MLIDSYVATRTLRLKMAYVSLKRLECAAVKNFVSKIAVDTDFNGLTTVFRGFLNPVQTTIAIFLNLHYFRKLVRVTVYRYIFLFSAKYQPTHNACPTVF